MTWGSASSWCMPSCISSTRATHPPKLQVNTHTHNVLANMLFPLWLFPLWLQLTSCPHTTEHLCGNETQRELVSQRAKGIRHFSSVVLQKIGLLENLRMSLTRLQTLLQLQH